MRNIQITNTNQHKVFKTKNKMIMNYIKIYIKEKEKKIEIIATLNHVQLYKKMILLCKLVGIERNKKTRELINPLERSCFKWRIKFLILPKPSKKSIQLQIEYTQQLLAQEVKTICNFDKIVNYRYQISTNNKYLRERKEEDYEYYEK